MNYCYTITTNFVSISNIETGESHTIYSDQPKYYDVVDLVSCDKFEEAIDLIDLKSNIVKFSSGQVTVDNTGVYLKGERVHAMIADKIIEFADKGLEFEPLAKFVEKLYQNPNREVIDLLYKFTTDHGIPINEDGDCLFLKRLRSDYTDVHTGKYDNSIGKNIKVPRTHFDNAIRVCTGVGGYFHVGAPSYVATFGSGGPVVVCKVNPKDVITIPQDCDWRKVLVCAYTVIADFDGDINKMATEHGGKWNASFFKTSDENVSFAHASVHSNNESWFDSDLPTEDEYYSFISEQIAMFEDVNGESPKLGWLLNRMRRCDKNFEMDINEFASFIDNDDAYEYGISIDESDSLFNKVVSVN